MSGSSNDHVLRDGARPDEMDRQFSTLSLRQLNVLHGTTLAEWSSWIGFKTSLLQGLDNIVRDGPPQNAMPKAMPKTLFKEYNHFQTSRPSDYFQAL